MSEEIDGERPLKIGGWEGEDGGGGAGASVVDEDCWATVGFGEGCGDGGDLRG